MHAEYRIEALLVTGHAHEVGAREPPRGTQLVLGGAGGAGTVVMSNLGYFQLPAAPGVFDLALRPGRSSQIYGISRPVLDLHGSGGGGGGGGGDDDDDADADDEDEDEDEDNDVGGVKSSSKSSKPPKPSSTVGAGAKLNSFLTSELERHLVSPR